MPSPIDRHLPPAATQPSGSATTMPADQHTARLQKTAREFEAVLLGQVVRLMFEGLGEGGPFGGGSAEAQWRDMLAEEYGRAMAAQGGIGLAVEVERAMRAAMPAEPPPDRPPPIIPSQGSEP